MTREIVVPTRLTPAQRERVERAAKREGLSVSAYLRVAALNAARADERKEEA